MRVLGALMIGLLVVASPTADDCTGEPTPHPDAGPDQTVTVFDGVHQHYGGGDTRTISAHVDFPEEGLLYERIIAHYSLACPDGGCDPWDRTARVTVTDEGGESPVSIEVFRMITPYGVGHTLSQDVTDLRPILMGQRRVDSFIDTWVNPGWLVSVSFEFIGGEPAEMPMAVIPLVNGSYTYGNPGSPIDTTLVPVEALIPEGASTGKVRVLATGHGFGYTENCAEFCQKTHTLTLGEQQESWIPWRDDCSRAGPAGQAGTFWYSRAGWCPGDKVIPKEWLVAVNPGELATFSYELEPYTNDVEGGNPNLILSAYLIAFE